MFIDACALVSILSKEREASTYEAAIDSARSPWTTPLASFEAVVVLARPEKLSLGYGAVLDVLLIYFSRRRISLRHEGDPTAIVRNALAAAERHGLGRRKLSTPDCFHYAAAKTAGSPMLTLDKLLRDTDIRTLP